MIRVFYLKTCFTTLGLAMGLVGTTLTAQAQFTATLSALNNQSTNNFAADTVTITETSSSQPYLINASVIAAIINWTPTSTPPTGLVLNGNGTLSTFCIDLNQDVYEGSTNNILTPTALSKLPVTGPPLTTTSINEISRLLGSNINSLGSPASNAEYAGLQVAIWAIIYGNGTWQASGSGSGTTLTSGSFIATGSDIGLAIGYLNGLGNDNTYANIAGLATGQDQVAELKAGYYQNSDGEIVASPAPPAIVLAVLGIVPCLALRRRLSGAKIA
jgi:hypothetical protein